MKRKYLYHGTRKKIIGKKFEPRKARGLGKNEKNKLVAIYATDKKDAAITIGIISGAKLSGMSFIDGKARGIIYAGWPKKEEVYLYILPANNFEKIDNWQWISDKPVKPIKVIKLKIKNYSHLFRKATEKEKKAWLKKHKKEIKNLK